MTDMNPTFILGMEDHPGGHAYLIAGHPVTIHDVDNKSDEEARLIMHNAIDEVARIAHEKIDATLDAEDPDV